MNEFNVFLREFKIELLQWIENPTVLAPVETMKIILDSVELAIELVDNNRKVSLNEKDFFEGGAYLVRYFDGWGEEFLDKYSKMVQYVKKNHF